MRSRRAAAVGFAALLAASCGLYDGGPELGAEGGVEGGRGDAAADVALDMSVDLNVEDRGTMTDDSGQTCTCVPKDAENAGWQYLGAVPMAASCPTGYGGAPSGGYVWNPQASGYGCPCSCSPTLPTCNTGSSLAFHYGQAFCGNGQQPTCTGGPFTAGQCYDCDQGGMNGGMHNEQTVRVDGLNQSGGSCTANGGRTTGTISTSPAQLCGYSGPSTTCMSGDACVELPSSPFHLCVETADPSGAITTCPNGFPKGIDGLSAGPTHVGTGTTDTGITCSACQCSGAPGTCAFGVAVGDGPCAGGGGTQLFTATATCASDGQGTSGFHPKSFKVSATPAITCMPNTPQLQGEPGLTGGIAVCCRQ